MLREQLVMRTIASSALLHAAGSATGSEQSPDVSYSIQTAATAVTMALLLREVDLSTCRSMVDVVGTAVIAAGGNSFHHLLNSFKQPFILPLRRHPASPVGVNGRLLKIDSQCKQLTGDYKPVSSSTVTQ